MRKEILLVGGLWMALAAAADEGDRFLSRTESWQDGTQCGWRDRDTLNMAVEWSARSFDGGALAGVFALQDGPVLPEYDAFVVDVDGSNGKFTGDFYAHGLTPEELAFDLLTDGVLPSSLILRLTGNPGGTNRTFWTSVTAQLGFGRDWGRVSVPLDLAAGGWRGGTTAAFASVLRAVTRIEVQTLRKGPAEHVLRIDNFTLLRRVPAALAALDSDGDGIPDYWEQEYFHCPTGAVATADGDLDGLSNSDELASGTDPTDGESVLKILDIHYENGWSVQMNSAFGIRYRPEANPVLSDPGHWMAVGPWQSGRGGHQLLAITNDPARLFLRIQAGLE